jgi:hypothetical protein
MRKNSSTGEYIFNPCGINCPNMFFNPEGGDVVYGGDPAPDNAKSKFVREVYIQEETLVAGEASGVKVVVNIKWQDKGVDKIYTLTERLYDVDYPEFFDDN